MKKSLFNILLVASFLLGGTTLSFAEYDKKGHHKGKFQKMDVNNDGAVDKKEFLDGAAKRFSKMDANNDGKIVKEEFRSHHKKMMEMKKKFKRNKDGNGDDNAHKFKRRHGGADSSVDHDSSRGFMTDEMKKRYMKHHGDSSSSDRR